MIQQDFTPALDDSTIAKLAVGALELYPFVDSQGMHIGVSDAVVTLTGSELNPDHVQRAISLLLDFTCVREVVNCTTIAAEQHNP